MLNHFEFGQEAQEEEMSSKYFLSGALAALLFGEAKPICAILKEVIMGNIHVKLYEIWSSGLRDVV